LCRLPLLARQGIERRSRGPIGPASRVQRSYDQRELEKAGRFPVWQLLTKTPFKGVFVFRAAWQVTVRGTVTRESPP